MNNEDFKEMITFMSYSDLYLLSVFPVRFSLLRKFYTACTIASLTDNVSTEVQLKLLCFYIDRALISSYMKEKIDIRKLSYNEIFSEIGVDYNEKEVKEFLKVVRDTDRFLNRQLLSLSQDRYETNVLKIEEESLDIFNRVIDVSDVWLVNYCCKIFESYGGSNNGRID